MGRCPGVELLGHMVGVRLTFKENTKMFSKVTIPFYIPTSNVYDSSSFTTSFPTASTIGFFDYSHSDVSVMLSLCGLNVYFSNDW